MKLEQLQEFRQLAYQYIQQLSQIERPVLAIDHTAWLRPHARTLKERTYEPEVEYPWTVRTMERFDAFTNLAIMVS